MYPSYSVMAAVSRLMLFVENMVIRLALIVSYWQEAQTLCRVVSQRLADTQAQAESLEIKYSKAKKLVRDYQSRYDRNTVLFFFSTVCTSYDFVYVAS